MEVDLKLDTGIGESGRLFNLIKGTCPFFGGKAMGQNFLTDLLRESRVFD